MSETNSSENASDAKNFGVSRRKRTVILMTGFGLGGLLWGLEAYRGTVGSTDAFTSPFSYILGAVAMGFFGGLALAVVKKMDSSNSSRFNAGYLVDKETLRIVGVSVVTWVGAFVVLLYLSKWLFLAGSAIIPFILSIVVIPLTLFNKDEIVNVNLEPSLFIGNLWLGFLVLAVIFCLVLHLVVMRMKKKIFITAILAFTVSALISPIVGNVASGMLDLLLVSYLITFLLPGLVLGMTLAKQR